MQIEPGDTSVAILRVFSERDWSQEAQGLGELYTEFVWIGGRAECRNKKRYTEVRGHGKGLGMEVRLHTVGQSKNQTSCNRVGVCRRDMQPGLCGH